MRLINYEIQRPVKNDPSSNFVFVGFYETREVGKKEFLELKEQNWFLKRKKYFLVTQLSDTWQKFSTNQKVSIVGIGITSIIGLLGIFHKSESLEKDEGQNPKYENPQQDVKLKANPIQIFPDTIKEENLVEPVNLKDSLSVDSLELKVTEGNNKK